MAINAKIFAPSTREEWLALRRRAIGASEISTLFAADDPDDGSPWSSMFKLGAIKAGLAIKDPRETQALRWGRLLEPVAIQCIREEHPDWIVQPNTLPNLQYFVDVDNRIAATPDAFVKIPGREGRGVIQIKTTDRFAFKRRWVNEEGIVVPPVYVALQAAVECAITDSQYAIVCVLVIRGDLFLDEIPLTPGLYAAAAARSLAFWDKIDNGENYDPDFEKDADFISSLYAGTPGKEIDLSGDNELIELIENDHLLGNIESETKDSRKTLRAKVRYKMKDAEIATFRGSVIATLKTVHRKASPPSSSRQLRLKGTPE